MATHSHAQTLPVLNQSDGFPLAIAHRAGNDLGLLRAAADAGVDVIEADVWQWRGRLEVRHRKTMGRIPVLWDRWMLAPGWSPRLQLGDLLRAARALEAQLMLDLKGGDRRIAAKVMRQIDAMLPDQTLFVCSRNWALLDPFQDAPSVRVVHSVGSNGQLRALGPRLEAVGGEAVSIHQRLLSPEIVRWLRHHVPLLMTWPVNSIERMDELVSWGITGVISDNPRVLRELVGRRGRSSTWA
jgi:glycerophosphoryl diester phosphodiesterase